MHSVMYENRSILIWILIIADVKPAPTQHGIIVSQSCVSCLSQHRLDGMMLQHIGFIVFRSCVFGMSQHGLMSKPRQCEI